MSRLLCFGAPLTFILSAILACSNGRPPLGYLCNHEIVAAQTIKIKSSLGGVLTQAGGRAQGGVEVGKELIPIAKDYSAKSEQIGSLLEQECRMWELCVYESGAEATSKCQGALDAKRKREDQLLGIGEAVERLVLRSSPDTSGTGLKPGLRRPEEFHTVTIDSINSTASGPLRHQIEAFIETGSVADSVEFRGPVYKVGINKANVRVEPISEGSRHGLKVYLDVTDPLVNAVTTYNLRLSLRQPKAKYYREPVPWPLVRKQ